MVQGGLSPWQGSALAADPPGITGISARERTLQIMALLVNGREVWYKTQKELAPVDHAVDLSAWAGETISLTLRVEALGSGRYGWAHWVQLQVPTGGR